MLAANREAISSSKAFRDRGRAHGEHGALLGRSHPEIHIRRDVDASTSQLPAFSISLSKHHALLHRLLSDLGEAGTVRDFSMQTPGSRDECYFKVGRCGNSMNQRSGPGSSRGLVDRASDAEAFWTVRRA